MEMKISAKCNFIIIIGVMLSVCVVATDHHTARNLRNIPVSGKAEIVTPKFLTLKPTVSDETQKKAVNDLLKRVLPRHYGKFTVAVNSSIKIQHKDVFKIEASNDSVRITASSGVSASWGVLHYLKYYCNCHVSWQTDQLNLPDHLPDANITKQAIDGFRYYQNVCTVSYSMVWWSWERWEKEIDWMALNGINLPLAFTGQETIWKRVYLALNLTEQDLDQHFAGPAFLAWGRMGNIRGWGGPLTDSWFKRRLNLQHNILSRMRNLGMIPVLPGFAGHVPEGFARVYPNSSVTRLSCWGHFNYTYSCTYFLHPTDPMFEKIGQMFIQEMIQEYNGTDHIYNADPFNEVTPSSNDPEYISQVGASIYRAMTMADPKAIWLMQGWLFFHNQEFWKYEQSKALLTSVPIGDMIVLDLAAEVFPQYNRLESFFGQPFIFCMLHNYGGVLGMYGMVDALIKNMEDARSWKNVSLIGTGLTPEGINQNYVMYDFMLDLGLTQADQVNITQWTSLYSRRRYGQSNKYLRAAWQLLIRSIYNDATRLRNHGDYIAIRRPSIHHDKPITWYDVGDVRKAWKYFIQAARVDRMLLLQEHSYTYQQQLLQQQKEKQQQQLQLKLLQQQKQKQQLQTKQHKQKEQLQQQKEKQQPQLKLLQQQKQKEQKQHQQLQQQQQHKQHHELLQQQEKDNNREINNIMKTHSTQSSSKIKKKERMNGQLFYKRSSSSLFRSSLNKSKLNKAPPLQDLETFKYDLVDITRQNLQNLATDVIVEIFKVYHQRNSTLLRQYGLFLYEVYSDLESILKTSEHFLLGRWVEAAASWGTTIKEKTHYKYNALNQISLWGPDGNIRDYAIKQWSGVVEDLIMPRWMIFINMMITSIDDDTSFNQTLYNNNAFHYIEQPFTFNVDQHYPINPSGDPVTESIKIYKKYNKILRCVQQYNNYNQTYPKSTTDLFHVCIKKSSVFDFIK